MVQNGGHNAERPFGLDWEAQQAHTGELSRQSFLLFLKVCLFPPPFCSCFPTQQPELSQQRVDPLWLLTTQLLEIETEICGQP